MNITRGKQARAQRVIIYGTEGIGKSTLAAQFPEPLFIDTEGSTSNMDVARMDKPTSWTMLLNQIAFVKANPTVCKTLIIDTVDWAEALAIEAICIEHDKKGIENFGFGSGYTYLKEEFSRFLHKLQELVDLGIHVVLTAHAQIRKFEQPDEMGAYDRYELKLGKRTGSQTAALVKEWGDMVLFCNYKTIVMKNETNKNKAQGGQRVIYTTHTPSWDAKNRFGLKEELPMDYQSIAHIFQPQQVTSTPTDPFLEYSTLNVPTFLPQELQNLMRQHSVSAEELHAFSLKRGFFPPGTPLEQFPIEYWGSVIQNWQEVIFNINQTRTI